MDDSYREHLEPLLNTAIEPNPRLRLLSYFESGITSIISTAGKCPSLVLKLASEANFSSPAMNEQISIDFNQRTEVISNVIQEGIDKKMIHITSTASYTAEIISSLWYGALQKDLSLQKVESLRTALDFISTSIIPALILTFASIDQKV